MKKILLRSFIPLLLFVFCKPNEKNDKKVCEKTRTILNELCQKIMNEEHKLYNHIFIFEETISEHKYSFSGISITISTDKKREMAKNIDQHMKWLQRTDFDLL